MLEFCTPNCRLSPLEIMMTTLFPWREMMMRVVECGVVWVMSFGRNATQPLGFSFSTTSCLMNALAEAAGLEAGMSQKK
jgi:hypothetical protein